MGKLMETAERRCFPLQAIWYVLGALLSHAAHLWLA